MRWKTQPLEKWSLTCCWQWIVGYGSIYTLFNVRAFVRSTSRCLSLVMSDERAWQAAWHHAEISIIESCTLCTCLTSLTSCWDQRKVKDELHRWCNSNRLKLLRYMTGMTRSTANKWNRCWSPRLTYWLRRIATWLSDRQSPNGLRASSPPLFQILLHE